jgi:hypothetical protein
MNTLMSSFSQRMIRNAVPWPSDMGSKMSGQQPTSMPTSLIFGPLDRTIRQSSNILLPTKRLMLPLFSMIPRMSII